MAPPKPVDLAPVTQWITPAALEHGKHLSSHLMNTLGVSRHQAGTLLRRLVALQWLVAVGPPHRRHYAPGLLRQMVRRYPLPGLPADLVWADFAPTLALPAEVQRMAGRACSELARNAVAHSGGGSLTVSARQTPLQLQLLVSDDGCGLFDHMQRRTGIAEPARALLALHRDGLADDGGRGPCGQGLALAAQLADVLDVHADQAAFQHRAWDPRRWHERRTAVRGGTAVYLAIALDTTRTLDAALRSQAPQTQRAPQAHGMPCEAAAAARPARQPMPADGALAGT